MINFYPALGHRVKNERLAKKWTREQLATKANISDKFLFDIENGRKGMSARTLYNLAKALGVSADWLMGGDD